MELQIAIGMSPGLSRAARAVAELGAVRPSERELRRKRIDDVRGAQAVDAAIDVALRLVAQLDPENDGAPISLADLEAKLRGAAE